MLSLVWVNFPFTTNRVGIMKLVCRHMLCCFILLLFTIPANSLAGDKAVAVLISREIAPYVEMVEGLEQGLEQLTVHRFFFDKYQQPYTLNGYAELNSRHYSAVVAVGPAALTYLQTHKKDLPLLFGMVLNPERLLNPASLAPCGVSLNLPVAAQLNVIQRRLPTVSRLGVLFDPANNQQWFDRAAAIAATNDHLQLVALPVQSQQQQLKLISDYSGLDAILFIPDKTIISQTVIRYVIKQAFQRHIPVIGYNQFFLDSGAALAFIIDYYNSGKQVAAQVSAVVNADHCSGIAAPEFSVKTNSAVYSALQLQPTETQHE